MKQLDIDLIDIDKIIPNRLAFENALKFAKYHLEHPNDTILVLNGLYGTGKRTILYQILKEYKNKEEYKNKTLLYKVEPTDTMDDIYDILEKNDKRNKIQIIGFENITDVKDFVDNSACLADIYAQYGILIIVTGDNCLEFTLADGRELFDRTKMIFTNYISYTIQNSLTKININNYTKYGGILKENLITDYNSYKEYTNKYIVNNIIESIEKPKYNKTEVFDEIPNNLLKNIIFEMLEIYSGFFNKNLLIEDLNNKNNNLNKLEKQDYINFAFDKTIFPKYSYSGKIKDNFFDNLLNKINKNNSINKSDIFYALKYLKKYFYEMKILGQIKVETYKYIKDKNKQVIELYCPTRKVNVKWDFDVKKEFCLTQPIFKYFNLQKKLEFIDNDKFEDFLKNKLTIETKQKLKNKLLKNIELSILKQITIFDITNSLKNIHEIFKLEFIKDKRKIDTFDFLFITDNDYDYYLFKVINSTEIKDNFIQSKSIIKAINLHDENLTKIVLYKGNTFINCQNGIIYFNIEEFLIAVNKYQYIDTVIENLCKDFLNELEQKIEQNPKSIKEINKIYYPFYLKLFYKALKIDNNVFKYLKYKNLPKKLKKLNKTELKDYFLN